MQQRLSPQNRAYAVMAALFVSFTALFVTFVPPAFAGGAGPVTVQAKARILYPRMTCPTAFPVTCNTPTAGNHAVLVVDLQQAFVQVDSVEITLNFTKSNPVDPHEVLSIGSGEGFENVTSAPIRTRTITFFAPQPGDIDKFVGSYNPALPVWMAVGSVRMAKVVSVTITGTLAPSQPVG